MRRLGGGRSYNLRSVAIDPVKCEAYHTWATSLVRPLQYLGMPKTECLYSGGTRLGAASQGYSWGTRFLLESSKASFRC